MKKNEIYTTDFIQSIKRKTAAALFKYIALVVFYVALCVTFCLLAAFDLVNLYVCCVLNVLLTIAFLWICYLFFTVYYKRKREKSFFVKCLDNAYPSVYRGFYVDCEKGEQYVSLCFEDGRKLKMDDAVPNGFVAGKRYIVDVVNDVIISYGEDDYE